MRAQTPRAGRDRNPQRPSQNPVRVERQPHGGQSQTMDRPLYAEASPTACIERDGASSTRRLAGPPRPRSRCVRPGPRRDAPDERAVGGEVDRHLERRDRWQRTRRVSGQLQLVGTRGNRKGETFPRDVARARASTAAEFSAGQLENRSSRPRQTSTARPADGERQRGGEGHRRAKTYSVSSSAGVSASGSSASGFAFFLRALRDLNDSSSSPSL